MITELALVSTDDLVDEISKRKEALIIAYLEMVDGEKVIKTHWYGDYILVNGLANVLSGEVSDSCFEEEDMEEDKSF
jgi:hypothetical protein